MELWNINIKGHIIDYIMPYNMHHIMAIGMNTDVFTIVTEKHSCVL